jgi:hypothetical protein
MKRREEHKRIAKQERFWAAQALRDAKYNHKQEERMEALKNNVLAANYRKEYRWDIWWRNRRLKIARMNERMGR